MILLNCFDREARLHKYDTNTKQGLMPNTLSVMGEFFIFVKIYMGWKIIEIESANYLNLFLSNIIIHNGNDKIKIPISDIDVLLINNYKLTISMNLINELANNNVLVIICNEKYMPNSIIVPMIGNYNTLKVIENQINWNHKWKSNIWKKIIKQKIKNQIDMIKIIFGDNDENIPILNNYLENIKEYDVTNREGHASKVYWHKLFGQNFKRYENDNINIMLNYGYTILRSYFTRSIIKKGLDPRISIFHKSFHNYFALSSDLMEPFRFLVDSIVYKLKDNKNLFQCKNEIIKSFNRKIKINGKYQFINNSIDIFVDSIVSQNDLPKIEIDNEFI